VTKKENLLKKFEGIIENHKPFIVNYGKNQFTGEDIKEPAYWDEEKKLYGSETGYWAFELLYQIAKGEVDDTTIEVPND
jgi:hypothetical protein